MSSPAPGRAWQPFAPHSMCYAIEMPSFGEDAWALASGPGDVTTEPVARGRFDVWVYHEDSVYTDGKAIGPQGYYDFSIDYFERVAFTVPVLALFATRVARVKTTHHEVPARVDLLRACQDVDESAVRLAHSCRGLEVALLPFAGDQSSRSATCALEEAADYLKGIKIGIVELGVLMRRASGLVQEMRKEVRDGDV